MDIVRCTSKQCDLSVYEVISLNTFEVMPQTRFHDAWTDGQGDSSITPTHPISFVGV